MSKQDTLIDFINNQEAIERAVERAMEKRQAVIDKATNSPEDSRPRAVQNGMSQAEYDTWMFLFDKPVAEEPYVYMVKQSDLTDFIQQADTLAKINPYDTPIIKGNGIWQ